MDEGTIILVYGNSHNSASRDKEEFKQVAENITKLFTLLTTLGVAVKTSMDHAGEELFKKNSILMNGLAIGIIAFFLVLVLHAMIHQHVNRNFYVTLLLLVLGTLVSVLASSLISLTVSLITLALWMIVFMVVVILKFQDLYKPYLATVFERINGLIESFKPHTALKKVQKWFEDYWQQQSTLLPV